MRLLMYGAGNIGRGFIAPLFAQAGYEVVFVDVDEAVVRLLRQEGRYPLRIVTEPPAETEITGVDAVDGRDVPAVEAAIAGCDIMATALGAAVLPRVAPAIAGGLARRHAAGAPPLDILICENLKDAAPHLRGWLADALPPDIREAVLAGTGLVEAAIGRMVPVQTDAMRGDNPLRVCVEAYDWLPVDSAAFVGPVPAVPQLVPYTPFAFYEERKLYLHNMGHAVCAYLGLLRGAEYIWQAVGDPFIRLLVQGAMVESASMLSRRYNEPFDKIYAHAQDLLHRFTSKALGDTCERVGRDPLRKLAAEDRLAAPLRLCDEAGIPPAHIAAGLAAALAQMGLDAPAAEKTLREVCRLNMRQAGMVTELLGQLNGGGLAGEAGAARVLAAVDGLRHRLAGKII